MPDIAIEETPFQLKYLPDELCPMLFQSTRNIDIVLASQSPRRRELLWSAGIPFRIWVIPVNEDFPSHLPPANIAEYLCKQKASAFTGKLDDNTLIITADTIVVKDGKILNKPSDDEHALKMLKLLSGATHEVITGVCLTTRKYQSCFHEITYVTFKKLEDTELTYYISNFKPFDKAGAYGIQEWIGTVAVTRIEGSWHNVVGLPVARIVDELKKLTALAFPEADKKK